MHDQLTLQKNTENAIDNQLKIAIQNLIELVQTPSDNPPGDCSAIADVAHRQLQELGFEVEAHQVPNEIVHNQGMISVKNLIVRERFGDGPVVALNAHGDVVPPGSGWSVGPYSAEIKDGWLYGRGAAVSKSDFVSYAMALKALKDAHVPLQGSVELHFTFDEEIGGLLGPGWLLENHIVAPDYVICAGFSHQVVIAHNGCLHLELTLRGTSAHAALPDTGHDAIKAAGAFITELYRYKDELRQHRSATKGIDHPTLVIGLIQGGINTNVVADQVTLRLDRRIIPEENPEQVEADLIARINQEATKHEGIEVDIQRILLAKPLVPTPESKKWAALIAKRGAEQLGAEVYDSAGSPLYTDARLYAEHGIPTIMFGAGPASLLEANGHRADERVPVDRLGSSAKAVALGIIDLLGTRTEASSR